MAEKVVYEILDKDGNVVAEVVGPPNATDAQILDSFERADIDVSPLRPPPPPPGIASMGGVRNLLKTTARGAFGVGEGLLNIGQTAALTPFAGLMGGIETILRGPEAGAERLQSLLGAARQPITPEGQATAELPGRILGPPIEAVSSAIGDVASGPRPTQDIPSNLPFSLRTFAEQTEPQGLTETGAGVATALNTALLGAPAILARQGITNTANRLAPALDPIAIGQRFTAQAARRRTPTPSTQSIYDRASAAFRRAEELGGPIPRSRFGDLQDAIENLRTRSGSRVRTNERISQQAQGLIDEINDQLTRATNFDDLVDLRSLAAELAGSADDVTALRGQLIKRAIDEFVDSLDNNTNPAAAEAISRGRELYSAARKADTIDQAMDIAEINSFTAGGQNLQAAIINQFKALERKIVRGQEPGFTQAERAAISAVARGEVTDTVLRQLAQFSPDTAFKAMASFGTGAVAGTGVALVTGMPALGTAVAGALPIAGRLSKNAAERRVVSRAEAARDLIRRGGLPRPFAE